jgi:hypothetical protein
VYVYVCVCVCEGGEYGTKLQELDVRIFYQMNSLTCNNDPVINFDVNLFT